MFWVGVDELDVVLFIYEYNDYIIGFDDVCFFIFSSMCLMFVYCSEWVVNEFWMCFVYVFVENFYFGVFSFNLYIIEGL